jgi:hypothetical protein
VTYDGVALEFVSTEPPVVEPVVAEQPHEVIDTTSFPWTRDRVADGPPHGQREVKPHLKKPTWRLVGRFRRDRRINWQRDARPSYTAVTSYAVRTAHDLLPWMLYFDGPEEFYSDLAELTNDVDDAVIDGEIEEGDVLSKWSPSQTLEGGRQVRVRLPIEVHSDILDIADFLMCPTSKVVNRLAALALCRFWSPQTYQGQYANTTGLLEPYYRELLTDISHRRQRGLQWQEDGVIRFD